MSEFREEFGLRLRAARLALGLTQKALAARIGVSEQSVRRYESAEREMALEGLANFMVATGIPASWLLLGCIKSLPPTLQVYFSQEVPDLIRDLPPKALTAHPATQLFGVKLPRK